MVGSRTPPVRSANLSRLRSRAKANVGGAPRTDRARPESSLAPRSTGWRDIGRVGVPHYEAIPLAGPAFYSSVTVGGGPAPVRTCIAELLPDILEGRIQGHRDMNELRAVKAMVRP